MNSEPLLDTEATENEEFGANKPLEQHKYEDKKLNNFLIVCKLHC